MSEYNMPPLGLFGKRCKIPTGIYGEPFVYRIVNDGINSNSWCEVPLMGGSKPTHHNYGEDILIVVSDTLINDDSQLIRVAKKDVEIIDESNEEKERIVKELEEKLEQSYYNGTSRRNGKSIAYGMSIAYQEAIKIVRGGKE